MRIDGLGIQTTLYDTNEATRQTQVSEDKEQLSEQEMVEKVNDFTEPLRTNLQFIYHEDLSEYYVAVIDPLTNEILKEIPPKKMLDMYASMATFMGILIDKKI